MKRVKKMAMAGVAVATAMAVQAEVVPYIGVSGGYARLQDQHLSLLGVDLAEASYDDGYVVEIAAGAKFDVAGSHAVRAELAWMYQENDGMAEPTPIGSAVIDKITRRTGITPPDSTVKGTTRANLLMANGYLDMSTGTAWTPFVMAGIGGAKEEDGDDTVLAWQVGAGIGYALCGSTVIDLKYKWFSTEGYEDDNRFDIEGLTSHQVQLGVRYSF